uniref:Uncharacterized protein n=1 Tax=Gasterosteus aculeatus aculeatus TaxID=481459 RepID=A0AAQ4NUL7_GASAC
MPIGDNSSSAAQSSFLGFTSFSIRDLLGSKERHVGPSLRTMDEAGEVKVSRLQVEGETPPDSQRPALCDRLHGSFHDRENSPMMRAVLCVPVCKVYRFQTEDQRWLLVREQMSETPLSFSLPKQLLSALIRSHASRVQEVKELGDLSPRWDGLRRDVIRHCDRLIGSYQETLAELEKLSASSCFKSSSSKSDKHLQFVPTNLHSQRMEVSDPDATRVWYEVITFGAPADHHQAFKHGGLKKLLSKHANHRDSCVSYSLDESSRARELLASVARLQPLVFGLAEELLSVSQELSAVRLQQVLDGLTQQTERFVHALKDELVRRALSDAHGNGALPQRATTSREGRTSPGRWDEEEWARQGLGERRREPQLHRRHGGPAERPRGDALAAGGRPLPLPLPLPLAGAAAPPGGHSEGLRARGGGEGPSRHDLRAPAGGGGHHRGSGTRPHR